MQTLATNLGTNVARRQWRQIVAEATFCGHCGRAITTPQHQWLTQRVQWLNEVLPCKIYGLALKALMVWMLYCSSIEACL